MATFNGDSYTDLKNINLKGGMTGTGLIRWSPASRFGQNGALWASNPFATTDYGLYINSSGYLVFSSLGTSTILGAAGSGGTISTWDQIFANDQVLNVGGTNTMTVTSSGIGSNAVLTVSETGAGTGVMIQVSNTSGSGAGINFTSGAGVTYDILGTASTWSAGIAGAMTAVSLTGSATTLTLAANAGNAVIIGTGSNTVTIAKAATFSSTVALSAATTATNTTLILTSNSNTVAPLIITDNTVTSYGAVNEGLAVIRSTSITSGTLLKLQAAEGTITGYYINAYDTANTTSVFSVRAAGATTILGAAYATAALTVTSGDVVISAGKILHTAIGATTTGGFLGTYAGITTGYGMSLLHTTSAIISGGSLLRLTSTGTNTSTTTGVLLDLADASVAGTKILATFGTTTGIGMSMVTAVTSGTALSLTNGSGIVATTGSMLTITANSATTAAGLIRLNGNGLTSGIGMVIASSATAITGAGRLLLVNHTGATSSTGTLVEFATSATDATNPTTILALTAGASIVGVGLSVVSTTGLTTGSLIKATTATTGAIATNGAIFFNATGAHTSTSNVGFVNIKDVTLTGTVLSVTAASLTTGIGIYMPTAEAGLIGAGRYISLGGVFSVAKYGATVIAGSAAATPALTLTAGDILLTSGNITLTANASTITCTGTGANGMVLTNLKNAAAGSLSGTALNVEISIGGTPYYFAVYPTKT